MKRNGRLTIIVLAAATALAGSQALCQILAQGESPRSDLTDKLQNAEIDWGAGYYYATGEGIVPSSEEEPNRTRAHLKARGYARMKAIVELRMAIEATPVNHKTAGKDCLAKDNGLRQTVEGYVANVEIVGEKQRVEGADTIVSVTVRAPIHGQNGVGSAIIRSRGARDAGGDANVDRRGDVRAPSVSPGSKGPFTSLIVDCGGLNVQRAISPKIRKPDGAEIWGTVPADADALQDRGIVAYARGIEDARRSPRSGANPLVVKAIGRAGGRFMCDAAVSEPDAERIVRENQASHFLDRFDVVFAVEGT